MIKLERVLCPTHLSEESERTLRYAVAIARSSGAKLVVCHRPRSPADEEEALRTIQSRIAAACAIASEATKNSSRLEWEILLLDDGDLATAITREAELRRVDLIFMRSRRRPFAAALLGSMAETVSRIAPCPVLVMHADEGEWLDNSTGGIVVSRILVAYDFSSHSKLALQYALALVQQYGAELHILHVLHEPITDQPEVAWIGSETHTPYDLAVRRLQEIVPAEVHLLSDVKASVRCGQPCAQVLAYAEQFEVDLISMGAFGLGFGVNSVFGSNVDKVLRHARCPVLIAHPLKQAEQNLEAI